MGSGCFTAQSYKSYVGSRGYSYDVDTGKLDSSYTANDLFTACGISEKLNPKGVIRECCDSDEHPNTIPVILALDVTGSMGDAAAEVAKTLAPTMTELYKQVTDVEFLFMGIDDIECRGHIQASQFESDIRIAEQLNELYMEYGGGGNGYESYTAAWVFGAKQTKLDCWNRGKKGILITIGDEPITKVLDKDDVNRILGLTFEKDISPQEAYDMVKNKYDVYHIHIDHNDYSQFYSSSPETFKKVLDENHVIVSSVENIQETITDIVVNAANNTTTALIDGEQIVNDSAVIGW